MMKQSRFRKAQLTVRQRCDLLLSQLASERSSFESQWADLSDYVLPGAYRRSVSENNRGDRRNLKIIDSSATFAARTLMAGLHSGVTSPARPWLRLATPYPELNEDAAVKSYLHDVTTVMLSIFAKSNLYNALPTVYLDIGTFATSAMALEEDEEDVIRATPFVVGTYWLGTDSKGRVRVFIREFPMTIRQMIEQFGGEGPEPDWSRFSPAIKSAWNRDTIDTSLTVIQAIVPNPDANPTRIDSKFKPFLSVYYEKGYSGHTVLEEKGYDEFPVLAPRWLVRGQDVYGTDCPGMTAIGDVKQLQLGEKKSMQAIEKMITPPMKGPAAYRNIAASLLPGGTTYGPESDKFAPVHEVRFDVEKLEFKQGQVRMRIQRAYYEDLFLMLARSDGLNGSQPVTAREIEERHEEKLLALGPVLERLNQDLLDPLVDRTFNIMVRRGLVPPAPEALHGVPLRVEYISVMAQAQKSVALAGIDRFLNAMIALAQAKPDLVDKIDLDQAADEYATATGIPPRIVRSDEAVAKIRDARAKMEQAAVQADTLKNAAAGAQTLSQTDTTGQNALTDILAAAGSGLV